MSEDLDIRAMLRLLRETGPFEVVGHVTHIRGFTAGGGSVDIEIFDDVDSSPRYHIRAVAEDGKRGSGNDYDDLETTIRRFHWQELVD